MKKTILITGRVLDKTEQKLINGGSGVSSCEAKCPGKKPAKCNGIACIATDGFGCYTDGNNGLVEYTFCLFQEDNTVI